MILRYLCPPLFRKPLAQLIRATGWHPVEATEEALPAGDYLVLLYGVGDELPARYPWLRFLSVETPARGPNVRAFDSVDEALAFLKRLTEPQTSTRPVAAASEPPRPSGRKRRVRKLPCTYCGRLVGVTALGLNSHEEACRRGMLRPTVLAKLTSVLQPSGRSKGSLLVVQLPMEVRLGTTVLSKGLHLITQPKLIKTLIGHLRKGTNLNLEKDTV